MPGVGLGIAKCPYDPYDNSTAIYIENGNPGGLPALVSNIFFLFVRQKTIIMNICDEKINFILFENK